MTRDELFVVVKSKLQEEFEIEDDIVLKEDASMVEDLGLDSLDFVDVFVIVEQEFGVTLKAEDFTDVKTLGQFVDLIYSKKQ